MSIQKYSVNQHPIQKKLLNKKIVIRIILLVNFELILQNFI
jgi:hypothetical protein